MQGFQVDLLSFSGVTLFGHQTLLSPAADLVNVCIEMDDFRSLRALLTRDGKDLLAISRVRGLEREDLRS